MRAFLSRIRASWRRRALDARLDEEVQAHLEELAAEYERRGLTREEACRAARRAFGGVEQMKDAHRDQRSLPWADMLRQDVMYAVRQLRHRPGLSIVAILTLALSMAAAIAVFTVVNGVVLRPLTYPDANRLVVAHSRLPRVGRVAVSDAQYDAWRSLRSLDGMALLWAYSVNLAGGAEPERAPAARVSPELFEILGVQPQLGRLMRPEEDQPGRDRVVLISDALWRRRFHADRTIVGRTISANGEPHEVVGVLPPGFRFPRIGRLYSIPVDADRPDVWRPLALSSNDPLRGLNFAAIARLRQGVTLAQAQSELDALQRTLVPATGAGGGNATIPGELTSLQEQITAGSRRSLEVLLAAAGAVLMIASLNVAGLIVSRTGTRRRELAVRSAVGATRRRLTRQLFTEGLVLSMLAGGAALAMAGAVSRLLVLAAPVEIPRLDEVQLDRDAVIFAGLLTLATTLIVGLLPAWRLPRLTLQGDLQHGPRAATLGGRFPVTAATLASAQLCATAVCAIVAGLLLQSFFTLLAVDKGFEVANIVTADLELAGPGYAGRRLPFERSMLEQLQNIPGVSAVALSSQQLLAGTGMNLRVVAEGASIPPLDRPLANFRSVNPDFFRTFGIPIHRGQVFAETDTRPVAVVSETTAARLWPGENAVGKRFRRGPESAPPIEVVGVAADVRATRLEQPAGLVVYLPYWQAPPAQFSIAIQTRADVQSVALAMREAIGRLDPALPVARLRTMDAVVAEAVGERRFLTVLVVLFAAIASLLAAMGVYGVISQRVTQRTAEIGLRLACGAEQSDVVRMVVKDVWLLTAIGVGVAVPLALISGSALRVLLFEVRPDDARTIASVCLLVAAAATAAAYVPARRASRINAIRALRAD